MPENRDLMKALREHLGEEMPKTIDKLYEIARKSGARTQDEIRRILGDSAPERKQLPTPPQNLRSRTRSR